ncbi:probable cytochrome P450 6a13 [Phlebotomus papatasi]|uniref:probable cytochrome P450 6a13 n=1 Tax=Phlebotomus papatasi TaxID=29031 RepID=UPI0024838915|nr:probable cytochrome P450 6a13 [Phlebotomus papatasi]XP_055697214.1 probable cytochrome P450 6a13 [Phlebotomus papatasi]
MIFYTIFALVFGVIVYIWYNARKALSYWSDRNVPVLKPKFPLGNLGEVGKKHIGDVFGDAYLKLKGKEPFAGFYMLMSPVVVPLDLDFIKDILIKDFQYFADRKIFYNEKDDPLSAHLFAIRGEKWRRFRQQLTPTFTSGKMKMMFPLVIGQAKNLQKYIDKHINESYMELKNVCIRFTADVIGISAFGLECRALLDEDSEILKVGKHFFSFNTFVKQVKFFFSMVCEDWARKLGLRFNHPEMEEFFMRVIKETVRQREAGIIDRNDFMKHLMEIKNSSKEDGVLSNLTFNELAAQAFIIFFAGFETSSTTMEWTLCHFALYPEIQERARQEVRDVMKKYNGELTYEAVQEFTYLRQCIDETLRIYPPGVLLFRLSVENYRVPNTDLIIEKGTQVLIPVMGIHMNPDIYPNPHVFDPDRFTSDNSNNRHPMAYLPFGDGPRNCIGKRFALIQVTVGLAYILNYFKFTMNSKTKLPLEIDPTDIPLHVKGGAWFNVEKLE